MTVLNVNELNTSINKAGFTNLRKDENQELIDSMLY